MTLDMILPNMPPTFQAMRLAIPHPRLAGVMKPPLLAELLSDS
jgi:hypothetical protein